MILRILLFMVLAVATIAYGTTPDLTVANSQQQAPASAQSGTPAAISLALNNQSKWEPKDYVLAAGVIVTLLLGIWNAFANHRFNQRTMFVNTVTSQRIKWIEQLRQDISTFSGLVYHWALTDLPDSTEERQIIKEIDRLNHVIRLRLNPAGIHDQKIEQLLADIPKHTADEIRIKGLLEELTCTTQALLKDEWEKVKAESKKGPLSDRA